MINHGFRERGDALEAGAAHENEMNFKVAAVQARMLGKWIATMMEFPEDKAEKYVEKTVKLVVAHKKPDDIIQAIYADLGNQDCFRQQPNLLDMWNSFSEAARAEVGAGSVVGKRLTALDQLSNTPNPPVPQP